MSKLLLAAVAATCVGACATTGNGSGIGGSAARTAATAASKYCMQDRLASIGSRHNCNWSESRAEACAGTAPFSTVDGAGYVGPLAATCEGGHRLVELRPKG